MIIVNVICIIILLFQAHEQYKRSKTNKMIMKIAVSVGEKPFITYPFARTAMWFEIIAAIVNIIFVIAFFL